MVAFVISDDGKFICDECGMEQDEHDCKAEVEGPLKGYTRYFCRTADVDA